MEGTRAQSPTYADSIKHVLTSPEYITAGKLLPFVRIATPILHMLFYFFCSSMGMYDNLWWRLGAGVTVVPAFFIDSRRSFTLWQKGYWDLMVGLNSVAVLTVLFLANDSTYWHVSMVWGANLYAFGAGKPYYTLFLYPLFVLLGAFLSQQSGTNIIPVFSDRAIGTYVAAWSSSIIVAFFRLFYDASQLLRVDLATERVRSENYRQLKDAAERALALEKELEQANRLEGLGRLAGGVAHDFNNMLTVISGSAGYLLNYRATNPEDKEELQSILTACARSSDLIQQLLAFSRQSSHTFSPVDVSDIVSESTLLLQKGIDRRIAVEIRDNLRERTVYGNKGMLQSAIINLGINAAHAMPEGGRLTITLSNSGPLPADVEMQTASDEVLSNISRERTIVIDVADTGVGIDKENLSKIFEPFFTTNMRGTGTGLGLAAVYGTVRNHHGTISVSSTPGKGSTFTLTFPITKQPARSAGNHDATVTGSGTIMVVDDEALVRRSLSKLLTVLGYEVVLFDDGVQAVEHFKGNSQSIDLVVLDMMMPRLSGVDTLKALREIDADVRVLLLSGYATDDDASAALRTGALGFVSKPFDPAELSQRIKRAIDHGR